MPGFSCQARSNRSGSSRGTGWRSRVRLIVVLSGQRRLSRYATTASTSRALIGTRGMRFPGLTPCGSRIQRREGGRRVGQNAGRDRGPVPEGGEVRPERPVRGGAADGVAAAAGLAEEHLLTERLVLAAR